LDAPNAAQVGALGALAGGQVLSPLSLVQVITGEGIWLGDAIEMASCALTAAGLYFLLPGCESVVRVKKSCCALAVPQRNMR
jgi:hypothetical protein